jgi:hypothetical protein
MLLYIQGKSYVHTFANFQQHLHPPDQALSIEPARIEKIQFHVFLRRSHYKRTVKSKHSK